MNWKQSAIEDLKKYIVLRESIGNIGDRIEIVTSRMESPRGATLDSTPMSGGGTKIEGAMLNAIVQRDRLKLNRQIAVKLCRLIEKGLSVLSEKERLVLDRFHIHSMPGNVDRLMTELGYEKSHIYRLRDEALYKFTIAMYGLQDL